MWRIRAAAVAMVVAASACGPGVTEAPSPEEAAKTPYGSWVLVEGLKRDVRGELLAVSPDRIYVRSVKGIITIPRARAIHITLWRFEAEAGPIITASLAGTVSTLSHGVFLILTAPAWALMGALTATTEANSGTVEAPDDDELRRWARFPQGLPAGFAAAHHLKRHGPGEWNAPPKPAASPWEAPPAGWQSPSPPADGPGSSPKAPGHPWRGTDAAPAPPVP